MCALAVANLGEPLLCRSEQFSLINTAKLGVAVQVLLVENLQDRVEQTAQGRIRSLLDNLSTGLLGVVFRDERAESVDVHGVGGPLLVGGAEDEAQLLGVYADGLEHGFYDVLVVVCAVLDQLEGRFEVIEEAMDVGEEDGHVAPCCEVLRDLDGGDEVTSVGLSSRRGTFSNGTRVSLACDFSLYFCSSSRIRIGFVVGRFCHCWRPETAAWAGFRVGEGSITYPSKSLGRDPRQGCSQ